MIDWKQVSESFTKLERGVWLNNCGVGLTPEPAYSLLEEMLQQNRQHHLMMPGFDYLDVRDELRSLLAELIDVDASEILLTQNTASAMNLFAYGASLSPGSKILLLENEYPSNFYPWQPLEKKGHSILFAKPGEIASVIESQAKHLGLVSLSPVHWLTGEPLPLVEISKLCSEKDIPLILDGAQAIGHLPIFPRQLGVQFMAFSCWKWLLGPLGLAAVYISKDLWPKMDPPFPGTSNVINDEQYLPYRTELKADAERYMVSTQPFMPWVHMLGSMRFLKELGFENVRKRLMDLGRFTRQKLTEASCELAAPLSTDSAIISFRSPSCSSKQLVEELTAKGYHTALREGFIRISPHICNHETEIEDFVAAVKYVT